MAFSPDQLNYLHGAFTQRQQPVPQAMSVAPQAPAAPTAPVSGAGGLRSVINQATTMQGPSSLAQYGLDPSKFNPNHVYSYGPSSMVQTADSGMQNISDGSPNMVYEAGQQLRGAKPGTMFTLDDPTTGKPQLARQVEKDNWQTGLAMAGAGAMGAAFLPALGATGAFGGAGAGALGEGALGAGSMGGFGLSASGAASGAAGAGLGAGASAAGDYGPSLDSAWGAYSAPTEADVGSAGLGAGGAVGGAAGGSASAPATASSTPSWLTPGNILKAGGTLSSALGGGGGSGAGGGLGGTSLGGLGGVLAGYYGMQQQKQGADDTLNYLKQRQSINDNMYAPNSPEYNALWQEMSRNDAAAGRNSQYGPRSVDLAARIAQLKMNANTQLTGNVARYIADANTMKSLAGSNLTNSIGAALAGGGGSGGSSGFGLSDLIKMIGGGSSNDSYGTGFDPSLFNDANDPSNIGPFLPG